MSTTMRSVIAGGDKTAADIDGDEDDDEDELDIERDDIDNDGKSEKISKQKIEPLTAEQIDEIKEAFTLFDTNHTGMYNFQ